jgi:hypothetical protein
VSLFLLFLFFRLRQSIFESAFSNSIPYRKKKVEERVCWKLLSLEYLV